MIKKILVPARNGHMSVGALETAIQVARHNTAILQILHITSDKPIDYDKPDDSVHNRQVYDAMAGRIFQKHGVSTQVIFAEGNQGPVIIRIAFEKRPDLIVMESGADSDSTESYAGRDINYVVRNAGCPVLVIPQGKQMEGFDTILYPVRTDNGTLKQFAFVRDVTCRNGKACRFEVLALLVDSPNGGIDYISGIVDDIERGMKGQECVKVSVSYNPAIHIPDEVLGKADEVKADLLVIPSTIDADNTGNYTGPLTQQIINKTRIPFLSVPNGR
jgi:nucleotide-binding universal stress UspA family protein